MKFCKKIITPVVVVLLIALMATTAFASGNVQVEAGKTKTVTFTFSNVFNVDGAFTVTDPQGIVSSYSVSVSDAGATFATVSGNRLWAAPAAEPVATTVKVAVKVTIKSGAAVGSSCTVSFTGIYGDANEAPGNEHDVYQSATVTVKETTAAPPPTTEPTPPPAPKADYTELDKQIAAANSLSSLGYTSESWEQVSSALSAARKARNSTDQGTVNSAAKALENAIAGLVKMDYTQLQQALDAVNAFNQSDELGGLGQSLADAIYQGNAMLASGDQAAVDAVAASILDLLDQVKTKVEELNKTEVVEIPVEVPVEVLPSDDYCNVSSHRVWPIAFAVSLAVNVILAVVIVIYVAKKAKNRKDTTPLVDYDIGDDE